MTTAKTPNPGSAWARTLGCKCPVIDNYQGRGYLGGVKDENDDTVFVYNLSCPLHFPKSETCVEAADDPRP